MRGAPRHRRRLQGLLAPLHLDLALLREGPRPGLRRLAQGAGAAETRDFSSSLLEYRSRGGAMLGGFIDGGAMEGGAIFFLREWRPRDGRSKRRLAFLRPPLLSRSRPAMPDRIERGSPKSSSNSSAFMSILRGALGWWSSCALYGGGGGAAHRRPAELRRLPQWSVGGLRCAQSSRAAPLLFTTLD